MGAGHDGSSERYERIKATALEYAFLYLYYRLNPSKYDMVNQIEGILMFLIIFGYLIMIIHGFNGDKMGQK